MAAIDPLHLVSGRIYMYLDVVSLKKHFLFSAYCRAMLWYGPSRNIFLDIKIVVILVFFLSFVSVLLLLSAQGWESYTVYFRADHRTSTFFIPCIDDFIGFLALIG